MNEVWKPIHSYETHYVVSNLGNVRRIKPGQGARIKQNLKPFLTCSGKNGYFIVRLCKDGIEKDHRVHRLVARAFLGEYPKGKQVNHKDTNKLNNVASNLEYLTHKENAQHASANGCWPDRKGANHPYAKLTEEDVKEIRNLYKIGKYFQYQLARMYKTRQGYISKIITRKNWSHI